MQDISHNTRRENLFSNPTLNLLLMRDNPPKRNLQYAGLAPISKTSNPLTSSSTGGGLVVRIPEPSTAMMNSTYS